MNQLYFMEIDPVIDDNVLNEMILDVSDEKKARLLRYRYDIDRKIGIYSDVLLRCMIGMTPSVDYKEINIKTSCTGKPYLASFPYYQFNISHTKNAVAAVLSEEPVGIDIEKIRDVDISIADKVFSDNELTWMHNKTEDKNLRFFNVWTKKEALVKYVGTGLTNDLKLLDVTGSFSHEKFSTFMVDGYVISICSNIDFLENDMIKISEPEFLDMWQLLKTKKAILIDGEG